MPHRSTALVFALLAVMVQALALAVSPVSAHDTVTGTPDVTISVTSGLSDREVHVEPGAIIRFVNGDDERHRFRSRDGQGFDTGDIEAGRSAQIRVGAAGIYTYIDERDDGNAHYHGRIVAGTASGGGRKSGAVGTPRTTAIVTIADRAFQPSTMRIAVGGNVTFRNADSDEHSATGDGIDSGTLSPGASYTQVFSTAGTYAFLCIFHPEMRGSIEVVGSESTTPKPPTTSKPPSAPSPTATPTPRAAPSTDANEPTAVQIFDLGFEPQTLAIVEGTKVRWTNAGAAPHTVTAGDGAFDSGMLQSGDAFDFTFTSPGTYAYACQVHPGMQGTIEVTATTAAAPVGSKAPGGSEGPVGSEAPVGSEPPTGAATASDGSEAAAEPATAMAATAEPASADLGSLGGIALAVTMISVASALFARLLRGTVRSEGRG